VIPPRVEALIAVLQANPVPDNHCRALEAVPHDGAEIAVGVAELPVAFATIVLGDSVAKSDSEREPAGKITELVAASCVKAPVEPLMGVPIKEVALIGPVKVAPVSGA